MTTASVLVCVPTTSTDLYPPCPAGQTLVVQTLSLPDDPLVILSDPTQLTEYWGLSLYFFTAVFVSYLVGNGFGTLLQLIRGRRW